MKKQVSGSLQKNICPFCGNPVLGRNLEGYEQSDSYEYSCNTCNPNTVVSVSGSVAIQIDYLISGHENRARIIRTKIKLSTDPITHVSESEFF